VVHTEAVVSTGPGAVATPRPAGSPWYTVQEPAPGEEEALGEEMALREECALSEEGGADVPATADPPAVIQSAAVRPATHPAVRSVRRLRIDKA
jgi:hypothetical protein